METPELSNGAVTIKRVAREPGSRSKVAVQASDEHIDPVGSLVGQRGVRVSTVMSEVGGEKIDIIEWSEDPKQFIEDALSPAKVLAVSIEENENKATVEVMEDQQSLAIGKGGQNVRLAAKLTGFKIDIRSVHGTPIAEATEEGATVPEAAAEVSESGAAEAIEEAAQQDAIVDAAPEATEANAVPESVDTLPELEAEAEKSEDK